ncbi:hypothetical protein D3C81_1337650 [compost metagenome]
MHQDRRIRIQRLEVFQLLRLELLMDDAGAIPEQHVRPGLALDVASQMLVRCPQDRLAVIHQVLDDFHRATGSHYPVGARLHGCRCVRVDHHGALRMLVAERRELLDRTAQVQRAGRLQGRHQHSLLRIEDLRRLAHETDASHHHRLRRMLVAEARHLEGVRYATTGLLGQRLDHRVAVIVRHQHRVLCLQFRGDRCAIVGLFLCAQRLGLLGGKMSLDKEAFRYLRHVY